MSIAEYSRQFEALDRSLDASDIAQARRSAFQHFAELGLPGKRLETWKYTDLSGLADKPFDLFPAAADPRRLEDVRTWLAASPPVAGASRQVFVDGRHLESLSASPHPGIELGREPIRQHTEANDPALAALNTAFAQGCATLVVTRKVRVPIELVFIGTGRSLAPQARLRFALAPHAEATVVLRFLDLADGGDCWLNVLSDIEQGPQSRLTIYRLQAHGMSNYQTSLTRARLDRDATLIVGNFELGGKLTRNELEIDLDGEGASAEVYGIAVTQQKQHCDTRVVVDHRAPRTESRQDYRTILDDSSRCIFNGKVVVQQDAQHIDARQRNDNLLLSSRAEVDSKPELEIYADQVVCSHGATVGELDGNHLFYLRSRGIDENTARSILATAFANVVLDRVELPDLREWTRLALQAQLPRRLKWAQVTP